MPYLITAVVLLGVVCLVNLALTLALIARLRSADAGKAGRPQAAPRVALEVGRRPMDFTAHTVDGDRLDPDALRGRLVGFFTPHCQPCHDRIREFAAYAMNTNAVAVLLGGPEEVAEMAATVNGVARTVIEADMGPIQTAFAVTGFPALCLVDDTGTVIASGTDFATFPALVSAK